MNPLLVALVDAVLGGRRRSAWALRAWPHRRQEWVDARDQLGWWRSCWPTVLL